MSLDAVRGFDMFFIMGLPALVLAVSDLLGFGTSNWICLQMEHVDWEGFRLMDAVFPTFMFISGISFPFSYARQVEKGESRSRICRGIVKRAAVLFLLGLVCEGITKVDQGWNCLRLGSVLGRIGIAWACAAFLYLFSGWKTRFFAAFGLVIGYWLLLRFVPAPDALTIAIPAGHEYCLDRGPFSLVGNLSGWVDRNILPGRISRVVMDTQGTLSTLPSIALPIFGTLTGDFVRRMDVSGNRKTLLMLVAAAGLATVGWLISFSMPLNKPLWSSSYVLVAAGYALFLFAVFYWIVDVLKWVRWSFFFRVIGMNSILIWMLQRMYGYRPLPELNEYLFGGIAKCLPPQGGALVLAVGYVAVCWSILHFCYRKNIILKV